MIQRSSHQRIKEWKGAAPAALRGRAPPAHRPAKGSSRRSATFHRKHGQRCAAFALGRHATPERTAVKKQRKNGQAANPHQPRVLHLVLGCFCSYALCSGGRASRLRLKRPIPASEAGPPNEAQGREARGRVWGPAHGTRHMAPGPAPRGPGPAPPRGGGRTGAAVGLPRATRQAPRGHPPPPRAPALLSPAAAEVGRRYSAMWGGFANAAVPIPPAGPAARSGAARRGSSGRGAR